MLKAIYPECPTIIRSVDVGGLTKAELLQALQSNSIAMNELAERLFAFQLFTTSKRRYAVTTVELTVGDLGFPHGAMLSEIYERVVELGLNRCPLELGPYLRLQYRDQSEGYWGQPLRPHQAPLGSLTVASNTIASEQRMEEDDFPTGFYLRRIKGVLWLRGYHAKTQHVWHAEDSFIFIEQSKPESTI